MKEMFISDASLEITDKTGVEGYFLEIEQKVDGGTPITYKIKLSTILAGLLIPDELGNIDLNNGSLNNVNKIASVEGIFNTIEYNTLKVPGVDSPTLYSGSGSGTSTDWVLENVDLLNLGTTDYLEKFAKKDLGSGEYCLDLGLKSGFYEVFLFIPIGVSRPVDIASPISITDGTMDIEIVLGIYNSSLNTFTQNNDLIHSFTKYDIENTSEDVFVPDGAMGSDNTDATQGKLTASFYHKERTLGENESYAVRIILSKISGTFGGVGATDYNYSSSVVHSGISPNNELVLPVVNITRKFN